MAVVKDRMAPELLNRLDEIAVFAPLSLDTVREIAVSELSAVCARLEAQGWDLQVSDAVAPWLAETSYDVAYGARHLQRNIEKEFLSALAEADSRSLAIDVTDGALQVTPV